MSKNAIETTTSHVSNFGTFDIKINVAVVNDQADLPAMPAGLVKRVRAAADNDPALVYGRIAYAHAICKISNFKNPLEVLCMKFIEPEYDPTGSKKKLDQLAGNTVATLVTVVYNNKMTATPNARPVIDEMIYAEMARTNITKMDFVCTEADVLERMKQFITEAFVASNTF